MPFFYAISRFEVLSLRLNLNKKKGDFKLDDFKGRILLADRLCVHELYNGKTGSYRYLIKENTTGDSGSYIPLNQDGIPNSDDGCLTDNSEQQIELLMTGPTQQIEMDDLLVLAVHMQDITDEFDNADDPNAYVNFLNSKYIRLGRLLPLNYESDGFAVRQFATYEVDKFFSMTADCEFGSVTLDFISYRKSMVLTVEVFLLKDTVGGDGDDDTTDTIKICGKLSVRCGQSLKESLLFWKTQELAISVTPGESIPLLRKVVAVDLGLPFTVHADLCGLSCSVKGDAEFVVDRIKDFKGEAAHTYEKIIDGMQGEILVRATANIL